MITWTTGTKQQRNIPAIDIEQNCFGKGANVASFYKKGKYKY